MESPTLKAVEKDRNTVMLCSATGDPEPSISWLKDYVPIDLADSRFKILPTGTWSHSLTKFSFGSGTDPISLLLCCMLVGPNPSDSK